MVVLVALSSIDVVVLKTVLLPVCLNNVLREMVKSLRTQGYRVIEALDDGYMDAVDFIVIFVGKAWQLVPAEK